MRSSVAPEDPARALLVRGVVLFNEERFFDAHEAWEELWLAAEDPTRRWLQGLIQLAAGWHHLRKGNERGGRRLLRSALAKLDATPAGAAAIDASDTTAFARRFLAGDTEDLTSIPPLRVR